MHTVGARLRARWTLSVSGGRARVRRRCAFVFEDGPTARSIPPRPRRRNPPCTNSSSSSSRGMATSATTVSKSSVNRASEVAFVSRGEAGAEDGGGRRVLAITDADFPRVLNGPAPGYAEDALRRLALATLPGERANAFVGPVRGRNRRGALKKAPVAISRATEDGSGGVNGVPRIEPCPFKRVPGLEGYVGAALSEGVLSENIEEDEEEQARTFDVQTIGHLSNYTNGGANGEAESQRWPRQQPFSSSAADEAYAEDDFVDPLMENRDAGKYDGVGEATDSVELPYSTLRQMQLDREDQSHQEACDKYTKMMEELMTMGKGTHLKPIERLLTTWYPALKESIEREQAAVWANIKDKNKSDVKSGGSFGGLNTYGPLLVMLKADKQAVLVMHEVVNLILAKGNDGVPTVRACLRIAELVQAEVNLVRMKKKLGKKRLPVEISSHRHVREINKKAQIVLDVPKNTEWPAGAKVKLGAALIKLLIETACWTHDKDRGVVTPWDKGVDRMAGRGDAEEVPAPQPAFLHNVVTVNNRRQGSLSLAPEIFSKMVDEDISRLATPRFVPMLVPPSDWVRPDQGGFLRLHSQIMRTRGEAAQKRALARADLRKIYHSLNCLGKVRWRINGHILDTVLTCLRDKIAVGDLPVGEDLPLPPVPEGVIVDGRGMLRAPTKQDGEEEEDFKERRKRHYAYRRLVEKVKQKNASMHSLRCDMKIKASIAKEFRGHVIYFPYNMDFRGRTYPIPPNLNILGADFSRGVLVFDEARPLGEKGLYWLKVHVANLYGEDKVSFDDRVAFVEANMDKVRDSALRPLDGECWWKGADSPWQCLAVCTDLTAALDSPDPTKYLSCLPVHQDGSCNGLQHYAALGLDAKGGAQVNLVPSDQPQDVYTGVCDIVKKKVALEASTVPPEDATEAELEQHRIAKMVDGLIDRKVVKQTVMTSVYGVTFVGARKQIQSVLGDKMVKKTEASGVPSEEVEDDIRKAAAYVAKHTMKVLEELFTEARNTMNWLKAVAQLISKKGQPMSWITPLGLPVLQPYRRTNMFQVQTLLQGVHVREDSDKLPISVKRQTTAFPPNFVHSLDSTHMMLTAVEMEKAGVPFAAVHDSYWVHAGNVDLMNDQLRQCFVDLYSGPILENLHESLQMRYPTIEFPPIPERGTLVLDDVKSSKYFFN
ncbi:unnamed protein product [Pylaiella littoralis]